MNKSGRNILELRLNAVTAAKKMGVTKSAALYDIARFTLYRWLKKYEQAGIGGLLNQSKSTKPHPLKTSVRIRRQIIDYFNVHPQATATDCAGDLNLTLSTVTINKIRRKSGCGTIPAAFNGRQTLYFGVETVNSSTARYLLWCKDLSSGLCWSALSSYNSAQALGVFADYLLNYLQTTNPVVFYGKGNFARGRQNSLSFFLKIVQEKYALNLLPAGFKVYPDNSLLNFAASNSNLHSEQQLYDLYTLQTRLNLSRQGAPNELKALPIVPVNIDKYLASCQRILTDSSFWTDQQRLAKEKYREVIGEFMHTNDQPAILSAVSLGELYELFVQSGIKDDHLRTDMQFELAKALTSAGLQDQAMHIYRHIAALYAEKPGAQEYLQAVTAVAESSFQRGLYTEAVENYLQLIKKCSTAVATIPAVKRIRLLVSFQLGAAESYKESGKFKRALNCYKLAEKISTDQKQKLEIALKRAMLFHIKGNHRQSIVLLQKLLKEPASRFLMVEIYRNLAMNYFFMWDYDSAEYYQRLQLKYIDKNAHPSDYAHTKFRIGVIIYSKDKNCNQPEYFTEQLEYNQKILNSTNSSKQEQISATQRIAAVYSTLGKIEESIALHKKALLMCYEISDFGRMCHSYNILSNNYHTLGDFSLALKYRKKELSFLIRLNMFQDIYRAKRQIAHFYYQLGESAKALQIYRELLTDESLQDSQAILMDAYGQSTIIYLEQRDLKNAAASLAAYFKICRQLRISRFIADCWILKSDYLQQLDENRCSNFKEINACFIRAGRLIKNCHIPADIGEWFYKYLLFLYKYCQPAKIKRLRVQADAFFKEYPNLSWQQKIAELSLN